jgi:hypothetical protein
LQEEERYLTADDLISLAAEAEINLSKRAIRDWPVWGGLALATTIGRGPGKGVGRVWTPEQAQVFLHVARARRAGVSRAKVVNLPVFFWLTLGDAYVPIEQVRRGMTRWIAHYRRLSRRELQAQTRQHLGLTDEVRDLLERDPAARRRLAYQMSVAPSLHQVDDYAAFLSTAGGLLPESTRRSAKGYAQVQRTRELGAEIFLRRASNELLQTARDRYRPSFDALEARLTDEGLSSEEVLRRLGEEEVGAGCPNLLTWLGTVVEERAAYLHGLTIGVTAMTALEPLVRLTTSVSRESIAASNRARRRRTGRRTRR